MKAGRSTTSVGTRFFLVSDKAEVFDWQVLDNPNVPQDVRSAAAHAVEGPTNATFCAALALIEAFLLGAPGFLASQSGSAINWRSLDRLDPPVVPQNFICIGLNYRDHAEEANLKIPAEPLLFAKTLNALRGHNHPVRLPRGSSQVDYEAELAVIIGRPCQNVSREEALGFVAGYTCANDISARDFQFRDGQWYRGKSADGFGPIGPWLVTPAEVGDPHKLRIRLRLNDTTMQDSCTSNLIFGVSELISYISRNVTLLPGDVIMTGTPSGVGFTRKPPIFLKPGDRVEVEIERIGTLVNWIEGTE